MKGRFVPKQHLTHSTNPYIHKCCGCIHLRMGSALTCLIWAVSAKPTIFFCLFVNNKFF